MTRLSYALVVLALACNNGGTDTEDDTDTTDTTDTTADTTDTTADTTDTTDTTPAECNTDNEECALGVRGCGGEGPDMLPGADCIACHTGGRIPAWSAGGTIFQDELGTVGLRGAIIRITDSSGGAPVELTSSRSGNFYTRTALTPPLTVEVEFNGVVSQMGRQVDTGACNTCHTCDGEAGGKLHP